MKQPSKLIRFLIPDWQVIQDFSSSLEKEVGTPFTAPAAVMYAIKFYRKHNKKEGDSNGTY